MSGDQFSQEFQLLYETDPLIGVVGLYYFEQTSEDIATIYLNPPPPGVQRDSDNNDVDNTSWAAFTQWTYKFADKFCAHCAAVATPKTTRARIPISSTTRTRPSSRCRCSGIARPSRRSSPSASFTIQWTDDAMTYLSYSEGFKGGGWNSHFNAVLTPAQQAALQKFEQEEAQTIELGAKFDIRRQHVAPEHGGVHVRLHRHAAHLPRPSARRRGAVHHQCG